MTSPSIAKESASRSATPIWPALSPLLLTLALAAGCTSEPSDALDAGAPEDAATHLPDVERPEGPAARLVDELTGGEGIILGASRMPVFPEGWVEQEWAIEGSAVSYAAPGSLPTDGHFELSEDASGDYRTRIVVRRPSRDDFNGTVVVEWLNVSGGVDANPDFAYLADELLRGGYAWVGVSAQHIGIEGGMVLVSTPVGDESGAGQGLRALDPERYGELYHPGDAFAYDIFTQVARMLRQRGGSRGATDVGVLGGLEARRILAVGESQSAFMLTTYINGVHPLVQQYDGFLVHSRGGGASPLGEPDAGINLVSALGSPATRIRDDLQTPVLVLQTETDLLFTINYFPARQPDNDHLRLWEIAGTAHADAYLLGPIVDTLGCPEPINAGPHHFVAKAALHHLDRWSRGGEAPPMAERLEIDASGRPPVFVRDANGNALGGIRTPQVDVPVDTLSGAPAGGSIACTLFGSTTPLPDERLAELYPSAGDYLEAYAAAAEAVIEAGFVLEADREALLADADPSRIQP